jgi:DNA-binding NarL/FixJ family response regulator
VSQPYDAVLRAVDYRLRIADAIIALRDGQSATDAGMTGAYHITEALRLLTEERPVSVEDEVEVEPPPVAAPPADPEPPVIAPPWSAIITRTLQYTADGMSPPEIARLHGIKPDAVKRRLRDARRAVGANDLLPVLVLALRRGWIT